MTEAIIPSSTPLADALAGVDHTQGRPGEFGLGPQRELAALRDLADAVRLHLAAHPEPVTPPGERAMFALINADNVAMEETTLCRPCVTAGCLRQATALARTLGDWSGSNDLMQLHCTEGLECLVCCYRPAS